MDDDTMLIGIYGRARHGKDTVGNMLSSMSGIPTYGFADPIKDGLAAMLDMPRSHIEKSKDLENQALGRTYRFMLQTLGTEWGRDIVNEDIWLLLAAEQLKKRGSLIVTDVRFPNEARWIKDQGGSILEVYRPNTDTAVEAHASESYTLEPDIRIVNDGGIPQLYKQVSELYDTSIRPRISGRNPAH